MSGLSERLVGLLDGDFIRVEGEDIRFEAEVVEHRREPVSLAGHDSKRKHTIRLMPIGESATELTPDRYRITVEPAGPDTWTVGELTAERFDEDALEYELVPHGEVTGIEPLEYR